MPQPRAETARCLTVSPRATYLFFWLRPGYARGPLEGGWAFYGDKGREGNVAICRPFDGQPARAGNGIMVALVAPSQDAVRAAHAGGLAHGGSDEGAPGFRPPDGKAFYGAYLRDPTGNKLCIFHMS